MKVRDIENLPVLLKYSAAEVGRVQKAIIGDDFTLAYLVIHMNADSPGVIFKNDFHLNGNAVVISDLKCIKSYAHGEESSIYSKKIGDVVFDGKGKQLGILSDFVVNPDDKQVYGLEVSSGILKDLLDGREEFPLESVRWASIKNAVVNQEGSDVL